MLQPDSRRQEFNPNNVISDNDAINNEMISEIEKELQDDPYDMISLVFLLYDVPDTALQRLIVFQRISKDIGSSTNLNMLHEWFRHAKQKSTWKHEFVEALLLCQLYSIVRKLGLDVPSARNYYKTDNIQAKMYINPIKKALYILSENMNADNLLTLKKSLLTFDVDASEYDSSELIFLKLMCEKFITVNHFQYNKNTFGLQVQLDKLINIIDKLPGVRKFAQDLSMIQRSINEESRSSAPTSTPTIQVDESNKDEHQEKLHFYNKDFEDVFGMFGELSLEENTNVKSLKSDRTKLDNDCFEIKNADRVGVCVIINQINFYPSKTSIQNQCNPLSTRDGSDKDQAELEKTMAALNFSVYRAKDLNHLEIFEFLKEIIKRKVSDDDSVFVLCILSHGVKGHIYAADSVKVKMDDFQKFLDSDIAIKLHGKPKLLIIQACQVNETEHNLVADSPGTYNLKEKTNFLTCWATAPELEAYRDEFKGSIFIQILCLSIRKYANTEHFADIFTKVTDKVTLVCEKLGCSQVPIFQSTLRKKLYIPLPQ